jgi:hypothetical protein
MRRREMMQVEEEAEDEYYRDEKLEGTVMSF